MRRYVLTGGPCCGKTTVLNILAERGYPVLTESAREIIEKEIGKESGVVPWKNLKKFNELVARKQLWKEFFSIRRGVIFLDRGIIDGAGYSVLGGIETPKTIKWFGRGRYDKIFLLDPLPFYETDTSRIEDESFARRVREEIRKAYLGFGYEVISVPMLTPEERTEFILRRTIGSSSL
ncbi:MAG: ATP-binding protein [Candidatus Paceibacterota bacterium]|jgi:predicted ATPase